MSDESEEESSYEESEDESEEVRKENALLKRKLDELKEDHELEMQGVLDVVEKVTQDKNKLKDELTAQIAQLESEKKKMKEKISQLEQELQKMKENEVKQNATEELIENDSNSQNAENITPAKIERFCFPTLDKRFSHREQQKLFKLLSEENRPPTLFERWKREKEEEKKQEAYANMAASSNSVFISPLNTSIQLSPIQLSPHQSRTQTQTSAISSSPFRSSRSLSPSYVIPSARPSPSRTISRLLHHSSSPFRSTLDLSPSLSQSTSQTQTLPFQTNSSSLTPQPSASFLATPSKSESDNPSQCSDPREAEDGLMSSTSALQTDILTNIETGISTEDKETLQHSTDPNMENSLSNSQKLKEAKDEILTEDEAQKEPHIDWSSSLQKLLASFSVDIPMTNNKHNDNSETTKDKVNNNNDNEEEEEDDNDERKKDEGNRNMKEISKSPKKIDFEIKEQNAATEKENELIFSQREYDKEMKEEEEEENLEKSSSDKDETHSNDYSYKSEDIDGSSLSQRRMSESNVSVLSLPSLSDEDEDKGEEEDSANLKTKEPNEISLTGAKQESDENKHEDTDILNRHQKKQSGEQSSSQTIKDKAEQNCPETKHSDTKSDYQRASATQQVENEQEENKGTDAHVLDVNKEETEKHTHKQKRKKKEHKSRPHQSHHHHHHKHTTQSPQSHLSLSPQSNSHIPLHLDLDAVNPILAEASTEESKEREVTDETTTKNKENEASSVQKENSDEATELPEEKETKQKVEEEECEITSSQIEAIKPVIVKKKKKKKKKEQSTSSDNSQTPGTNDYSTIELFEPPLVSPQLVFPPGGKISSSFHSSQTPSQSFQQFNQFSNSSTPFHSSFPPLTSTPPRSSSISRLIIPTKTKEGDQQKGSLDSELDDAFDEKPHIFLDFSRSPSRSPERRTKSTTPSQRIYSKANSSQNYTPRKNVTSKTQQRFFTRARSIEQKELENARKQNESKKTLSFNEFSKESTQRRGRSASKLI
ncbi:uncharacterized protein MONOS_7438 [Monocercomonoides exilis]|uniref:uncharacterized protein n=1 Tax=Monocercomonoides exilis TaxID=2049356 RepID=UPI003559B582|nr:hypothetical protein MONOS_7438 [Monocercomonoides exilis]|eukprot:MONOS_7438.1-p1 / transcript=MONOS_7438.1 / gene=MONOS_7438 / organism=Monocercomonoides_exilis_PA203 / gene_product=unspecified product / transcript_product=unspecified product / location=Mono_scaffold00254:32455-35539(-) / protein_length=996 / sequence_SO=supercontig / SO=protein_coding / is_pseudo=false